MATAIHAAHAVRPSLLPLFALDAAARLYEEDPFTDRLTALAPTRVVGTASRFEIDLNRPLDGAIYERPEQAWGLHVWRAPLPAAERAHSRCLHDAFYREMEALLADIVARCGRLLVLDLHSYNQRRGGSDAPLADPAANPEINIGTAELPARWRPAVDALVDTLRSARIDGRPLDVRRNVKFKGGHFPRWVNGTFGHGGCAVAIEFRKIFMDEHTGELFPAVLGALDAALRAAAPAALAALEQS